jgi:lactoylglutathione lyase
MKPMPNLIVVLVVLLAAALPAVTQEAAKKTELRKPGFIFLELGTQRVSEYVEYFRTVLGYEVVHQEQGYASMESNLAQLLLMDPRGWPKGHPFYGKTTGSGQGIGVEIGLVVADLDKTFAAAVKQKGWPISTGIVRRPWGVRDFRVLSPDGYYLRFTE